VAPEGPPIQPAREFLANKSKQNQAKKLGFAWFYSSESGLFNGLRRIQIRKIASSVFGPRSVETAGRVAFLATRRI
jgi:hypothetical protein